MKYTIREVFEEGSVKYLLYRHDEPAADPIPTNAEFEMWGEIEELQKKVAEQQMLLDFFYDQMQNYSPRMNGQHHWRFRSGGWPMGSCVGETREEAAMNAVKEIQREKQADELNP